ncbi:hypothetical protein CASFOL_024210 [Castilleja foliolosa]|uniref:Uncharacterized protein n=1 Tax=Castilleja foliolosa TaxID=1961234 RepID=A0ABD3CQP3_9LAMI
MKRDTAEDRLDQGDPTCKVQEIIFPTPQLLDNLLDDRLKVARFWPAFENWSTK